MDISNATALASAIVALVCPAIVQAVKKYIPSEYVGLFSLAVSIILGVLAIAATGGFDGNGWGVVLAGVVGVAQVVYTAVNSALGGKLSKDKLDLAAWRCPKKAKGKPLTFMEKTWKVRGLLSFFALFINRR